MNSAGFIALQALATSSLGAAALELSQKSYNMAILLGLFGIACLVAWELIPDKKTP